MSGSSFSGPLRIKKADGTKVTIADADGNLDISSVEIDIATGNILIGDNAGNSTTLDVSGDKKIMIGNGTTATSQSVSGDITISNLGVTVIGDDKVTKEMINGNVVGAGLIQESTGEIAHGVTVFNNTGVALTPGTLVYLSSYTGTSGITVVKADADANIPATHVVLTQIDNSASGNVYERAMVGGLNTNGRTIGDAVYLDATTAGGYTYAAPTGADQVVQQVGTVKVVSATVGQIEFWPSVADVKKVGSSYFQPASVLSGAVGFTIGTHGADTSGSSTASVSMGGSTASDGAVASGSGTASISTGGTTASSTASVSMGGSTASGTASISIGGNADSDGAVATSTNTGGGDFKDIAFFLPPTWAVDNAGLLSGLLGQVPAATTSEVSTHAWVYKAAGTVWAQLSASQAAGGGGVYTANFQVFPDAPANGDAVYFGFDKKTPAIYFPLSATVGAYTGAMCAKEYWNGASWVTFPMGTSTDNTDTATGTGVQPFARAGSLMIVPPSNMTAYDPGCGQTKYWVRYVVTDATKFTTAAIFTDEHSAVKGEAPYRTLEDMTIQRVTLVDGATTLHTGNDIRFVLWKEGSSDFREFTFAQDRRSQSWTLGAPWDILGGSDLSWYCCREDETNEPVNAVVTLRVTMPVASHTHTGGAHTHALTSATATDAGHTHGATGLTATDAGHTHGATGLTATDAGHTHTGGAHTHGATGLTATDAGHTHSTPSLAHSIS